jgi:hypothetical protein
VLTSLEPIALIEVVFSVTAILLVHLGTGDTSCWGRIFPKGLVAEKNLRNYFRYNADKIRTALFFARRVVLV